MEKISKEDGKTIMSLTLDAVLARAMVTTTPTDWAKAGAGVVDTLPVTLQFPEKFVTEMLSRPGGESALNLFVTFAIAFYITAKAEEVAEGYLDNLVDKIKEVVKKTESSPPTTHESQSVEGLTQKLMKRIVVN
jgi:hypothetical protein